MPLHIREAVAKYVTVAMVLEAQAKIKARISAANSDRIQGTGSDR